MHIILRYDVEISGEELVEDSSLRCPRRRNGGTRSGGERCRAIGGSRISFGNGGPFDEIVCQCDHKVSEEAGVGDAHGVGEEADVGDSGQQICIAKVTCVV
jgi:hypothetical protein